jgi:hypothetical protein
VSIGRGKKMKLFDGGFITFIVISIVVAVLLSGCTNWEAYQAAANHHGKTVADEEFESIHWAFCRVPRIGAVERRFGDGTVEREAYDIICVDFWD